MFEQVLSIGHLISETPKVNKPTDVLILVNSAANIILEGHQNVVLLNIKLLTRKVHSW